MRPIIYSIREESSLIDDLSLHIKNDTLKEEAKILLSYPVVYIHFWLGKTEEDPIPDIVGYAHIHSPNIYRFKNKTLFNTGSVGLPIEIDNDEEDLVESPFSTMASYMIMEGNLNSKEFGTWSLQLVRLPYDINKELSKLEKSDIPGKETLIKNLKYALS